MVQKLNLEELMDTRDIVISGISGQFPNCDDFQELQDRLFNKEDLKIWSKKYWNTDNPDMPHRMGKVKTWSKFDAEFFNFKEEDANMLEPSIRRLLEHVYSAIADAGVNPHSLYDGKTAVVGAESVDDDGVCDCYEHKESVLSNDMVPHHCNKASHVNWISSWFNFHGPSFTVDTMCSSTLFAMRKACDLIKMADGFTRAESVGVMFLQKASDARRAYASVEYLNVNADGYKNQGITFPSAHAQAALLRSTYSSGRVSAADVGFLEMHSTGTKVVTEVTPWERGQLLALSNSGLGGTNGHLVLRPLPARPPPPPPPAGVPRLALAAGRNANSVRSLLSAAAAAPADRVADYVALLRALSEGPAPGLRARGFCLLDEHEASAVFVE
ncbi:Fatty acid synthase, partial [Gryllus bimaculatus]